MIYNFDKSQVDKVLSRIDKLNKENTPATVTAIKTCANKFNNEEGGTELLRAILNDLVAQEILIETEKDMGNNRSIAVYYLSGKSGNDNNNIEYNPNDITITMQTKIGNGKQIIDLLTSENASKFIDLLGSIVSKSNWTDKLAPLFDKFYGNNGSSKDGNEHNVDTLIEAPKPQLQSRTPRKASSLSFLDDNVYDEPIPF